MGSIQGSFKIPLALLSEKFDQVPKKGTVVVVDHAGKQSLTAARFLKKEGYENVKRLDGGLMAWVNQGFALQK